MGIYYYWKDKQAIQANRFKRNEADPCLFYAWSNEGLVIWVIWVDNNLVIALHSILEQEQDMITKYFECNNFGNMTEYIGCKIKIVILPGVLKFLNLY